VASGHGAARQKSSPPTQTHARSMCSFTTGSDPDLSRRSATSLACNRTRYTYTSEQLSIKLRVCSRLLTRCVAVSPKLAFGAGDVNGYVFLK